MTEFEFADGAATERDVTDFIDDLTLAGVNVVPGNYWWGFGYSMSECSRISVSRTDVAPDEAADIDRLKGSVSAYIAQSGRVWWLGQCVKPGELTIAVAVDEFEPITGIQSEAIDVVLSVLDAVAFDARVESVEVDPSVRPDVPPPPTPEVPPADVPPTPVEKPTKVAAKKAAK